MTDLREELARAIRSAQAKWDIKAADQSVPDSALEGLAEEVDAILPIVARAVAAEREACAELAARLLHPESGEGRTWNAFQRDFAHASVVVAAAIRARRSK